MWIELIMKFSECAVDDGDQTLYRFKHLGAFATYSLCAELVEDCLRWCHVRGWTAQCFSNVVKLAKRGRTVFVVERRHVGRDISSYKEQDQRS